MYLSQGPEGRSAPQRKYYLKDGKNAIRQVILDLLEDLGEYLTLKK